MNQDLKYVQHIQLGHESGLKFFMSKFGKSLRFFAYSIVQNKEVAEEIVSDSFFKLWNGRDRIKSANSIKSFLFITTQNACYDYVRCPKRKINSDADALEKLVITDADTLTKMIYVELIELVVKEVNKLPEQQASVFKMSYLQELSTQEISKNLGTTSNSVYFARSKALSIIRKALQLKDSLL